MLFEIEIENLRVRKRRIGKGILTQSNIFVVSEDRREKGLVYSGEKAATILIEIYLIPPIFGAERDSTGGRNKKRKK